MEEKQFAELMKSLRAQTVTINAGLQVCAGLLAAILEKTNADHANKPASDIGYVKGINLYQKAIEEALSVHQSQNGQKP